VDYKAFHDMKIAISNFPKLAYLEEVGELVLQTDASDYGIGAYLFQNRIDPNDGREKAFPIMFVSKA
jgi:hypothetical protein